MDSTFHRPLASALALFCLTTFWLSVPALAENVGDPCTGTNRAYSVSGETTSLLICNGSTLELLEKDLANPIRKGIGTTSPAATLHVNGEAILGNTGLACSGTTEGAMRYNGTTQELEYCDGSSWTSLSPAAGGSSFPYCAACNPPGYFVKTNGSWNGNMGGRSGADAKCLSDLTTYGWNGKADASARGILDSTHVKAFLCDSSSCEMGKPFTRYYFATSNNTNAGGSYFDTDTSGEGPFDTDNWSDSTHFNASTYYWSGRTYYTGVKYPNSSSGSTCSSWSDSSGSMYGQAGSTAAANYTRWAWSNITCNSSYPLVCFVHPTP